VVVTVVSFSLSSAQEKVVSLRQNLAKTISSQPYVLMNANNLTSWVRSDGFFPAIVGNSWNGEFPKGSGVGTVYQEGIVFGGKVHDGVYTDSIRVTGDTYFIGMQAGAIKSDASGNTIGADDPNDPSVRAFGIRSDMPVSIQYDTAAWPDLKSDAASFFQKGIDSVTAQDVHQIAGQYFKDWTEWPTAKGAPWFVDSVKIVRNDAAFDPTNAHDIPGIPDAAKTIWFVCNDENLGQTGQFAGSPPIGIEEQVTLWAVDTTGTYEPLNNVIFKQVKLIYKGNPGAATNSRIDSMFISQWADGDIGDDGDDYGGCDTMLNLGYQYNSKTLDARYSAAGLSAPAMGYVFLQGTSHYTGNPSDSAAVSFQWRKGYRYSHDRPMTTYFLFGADGLAEQADNGQYSGSLQWFNIMRGRYSRPAYPAGDRFQPCYYFAGPPINYQDCLPTDYMYSGDPTTGKGWLDGYVTGAGARQIASSHGPFDMALHDTAEVVIALVDGLGANNLWSVQVLKYNAGFAKYWFNGMASPSSSVTSVAGNTIPRSFEVSQNYPNPFNPSTTIRYEIPISGKVTIKVFNLLGQDIATIVDDQKQAGVYSVQWNATNVPSGVYFYSTKVTPNSKSDHSYWDVKKMLLMK
jgi:hypothetical protein